MVCFIFAHLGLEPYTLSILFKSPCSTSACFARGATAFRRNIALRGDIAEESLTHKVWKDRFFHILHRILLKYLYIPQRIWLVYEKIYSFQTASHLPSNKFLMDFAVTSRSKVSLYKARCDERRKNLPMKDLLVRLSSAI